jgi:hypothetical protein
MNFSNGDLQGSTVDVGQVLRLANNDTLRCRLQTDTDLRGGCLRIGEGLCIQVVPYCLPFSDLRM